MLLQPTDGGLVVPRRQRGAFGDAPSQTERLRLYPVVGDEAGQQAWGRRLARLLPQAYRELVAAEAARPG